MSYRTVELAWTPRSTTEWATFSAGRREAARLWNDLVLRHHRIRRLALRWPSKARWQRWAKGRYLGLSAQSAQQLIRELCDAVDARRRQRMNGHTEAPHPGRLRLSHDEGYPHQDARIPGPPLGL